MMEGVLNSELTSHRMVAAVSSAEAYHSFKDFRGKGCMELNALFVTWGFPKIRNTFGGSR